MFTTSCKDDFLDITPLDQFSSADVFTDESLAKSYINGIYINLNQSFQKRMQCCYTDEGLRRDDAAARRFNNCEITADVIPSWSLENWQKLYLSIRRCNLFLENIENATFNTDGMIGEVKFLRAWNYFMLTNMYGGVPLVKKVYQLTDDFLIERSSYEDCINFIVEDLDEAANLLPIEQTGKDNGRATKGAALALKARVLLYAASDLHNTAVFPGYSNPELIGYTDMSASTRKARWLAAKNAAKAVIDLRVYSLYKPNPAPADSVAMNYEELFITKQTIEDIWIRFQSTGVSIIGENVNSLSLMNPPNGWGGQSNNVPTGNLVNAFEMRNGTKFDWNNPAHAASPYNNREPRFYAYILYEGAKWRPRPEYSAGLDPEGIVNVGYFERWDSEANRVWIQPGLDSRSGPFEPNNSSPTLYNARKFLDPAVLPSAGTRQAVSWRYIRFAEVLLNYAEACIELGDQDEEARTYINMIRTRAGLPGLTESGDDLRIRYRNERFIELMYEEHRFFDIRRWLIGPEAYVDVYKANVLYKLLPDNSTSTKPTILHEVLEHRSWLDKAYLFPILRSEMNKNELLIQNPGY